ncbi:hypothetical protein ACS0TY_016377 [Phlomoides rotata]
MAASVQIRPQNRDLGMVMREVDEDLAIFLGIRRIGETERNGHDLVDEFDDSKSVESKPESLFNLNASQGETFLVEADDNFLNLEMEKSETNWLVSQPDTPLLPSAEAEGDEQRSSDSQTKVANGEAISLKSELENTCKEEARKPARRAATPTGRPSLPVKSKATRSSTPTSRSTLPSSKPISADRKPSTPLGPLPRSSTPSSRPSIPIISKSTPRSATPTRKPTTLDQSSSGRKTGLKSLGPSRGASPSVKSRPSKPLEMLSVSHDASQNSKVSMPKRPVSASRGRVVTGHLARSNDKPRRESYSPPRVRAPITCAYKTGSKILSRSRNGDDVNPVVMGTKMVDRVVNMRKLAPPKQDEYVCHDNTKKSSHENSGFGRSLSKKSLDMAMRHMDIRRSVPEKIRASATGSGKSSTV